MREALTFDDVLIVPKFSTINSRKDVDISFNHKDYFPIPLPIISSNMDTVTGPEMAIAMSVNGGIGCLHRFSSIEDNVKMFLDSHPNINIRTPMVSIGLGNKELERAEALYSAGAFKFVIDVANGAQMSVVNQVKALRALFGSTINIIVGNFATGDSVISFLQHESNIQGIKVGIGPGSACTTRIKTGIGYPQLSAIMDVAYKIKNNRFKCLDVPVIADGGIRSAGDVAKALGAGANMVMLGGMLAGTEESPGETLWKTKNGIYVDKNYIYPIIKDIDGYSYLDESQEINLPSFKKYRGSASKESYKVQGKDDSWRTAEGESFVVPYKGPVKNVLQDIEGGLRSSFSYVGARNLPEFHDKVEFVRVSSATVRENGAHGKE